MLRGEKLFYQIPTDGKAGPQSQLKEACIFLIWFTWHSPLYTAGTHLGAVNTLLERDFAVTTGDKNDTFNSFSPSCNVIGNCW